MRPKRYHNTNVHIATIMSVIHKALKEWENPHTSATHSPKNITQYKMTISLKTLVNSHLINVIAFIPPTSYIIQVIERIIVELMLLCCPH
jgi:hypothetical protein